MAEEQLSGAQGTEGAGAAGADDPQIDWKAEAKELKAERDRKAWAEEISKETGVPAEVLRGETREEMEAHAGAIKPLLPNGNRTHVGSEGGKPVDAPAASGDWLREAIAGI